VRNPRPLLGYICGNRHNFASNAWSGSGLESEHQSLIKLSDMWSRVLSEGTGRSE
jgi:hypothetical protein